MRTLLPLRQFYLLSIVAVTTFLGGSCSSDDDAEENDPSGFWQEARLKDFPLFEVAYLDIDITHPEIANGVETKQGKILITIPFSQTSLTLSLKQFDLNQGQYNITPYVGEPQDFSGGPVTYTITDASSATKAVHYEVTIVHGGDPFITEAKITGFKFEKDKNPALAATVEAVKIIEYKNASQNAIYVIMPVGTDFSQLTPTITYQAAKLYYKVDTDFFPYPEKGLLVDFKYPKQFQLQAENSRGTKSLPYAVIVDVANPIRFDSPIVTANVKSGDGISTENFFAIATWTNQGNHPITGMAPMEYKDKTYPVPNYPGNANIITASIHNPNAATKGVMPGQTGTINVTVKRAPITGLFSTTAVFVPTFSFDTQVISYWPVDDRIEGIFQPHPLAIQTTIE